MSFLKINDLNLFYKEDYFGHDQTLLFSNSLGTDYTMWEPQIDILSHQFNILRYDSRGHGQSFVVGNSCSVEDLGNDVIALLDYLNHDKVYFCGLSMGGQTGQWLGIHHPERFHKIILANTAAKIGTEEGWNQRIEFVGTNGLEGIMEGTADRWFTPEFRANNENVVNEILKIFKETAIQGYISCCKAVRDAVFLDKLFMLEVPTLIISGIQDSVTTIEQAKYMAKYIPVASHISLDAAHLSNIECAEEFSKHLLFFTEH